MTDVAQFRADFKAVFAHWRNTGEMSEQESSDQFRDASAAVQANMHDAEWMQCAVEHFRGLATAIKRNEDRSQRIRTEARTEKERA